MSRIASETLIASEHPVPGRLVVLTPDYDAHEKCLSFLVPSQTREQSYVVCIDMISAEVVCNCEWFQIKCKSKKFRDQFGVAVEHRARMVAHKTLLPSITRAPKGLCYHTIRARAWVMRHDLMPVMELAIAALDERLDGLEAQRKSA